MKLLFLISIFLVVSLAISASTIYANPIRPSDNAAKRVQINAIQNTVNNHNCDIGEIRIRLANTSEFITIYNNTFYCGPTVPTPTPTPPPITCPAGQHVENGVCVPDVTPTPNPPPSSVPVLNTSKTFRIAIVGDVDNNNGLVTQMNLAKKYESQYLVIPGDYAYSSAAGVQSKVKAVFPEGRTIVANGNHDQCSNVKSWISVTTCYYQKSASDGRVDFMVLDANSGFDCIGTQFQTMKSKMESSDAWYKVVVIHQPFATVKSQHGPNGQFDCWNPVFQSNGVNLVAQAHNHNYQIGKFGSVYYGVFGMGTHDTGSAMYPCSSSSFNNVPMKCKTGTNGIEIVDFPIDRQGSIKGYFVSNADKLVETFN